MIMVFLFLALGILACLSTPTCMAGPPISPTGGKNPSSTIQITPSGEPKLNAGPNQGLNPGGTDTKVNPTSNAGGGGANAAPGSPCTTASLAQGRWFGTPGNLKCAGLGDSCPAQSGPGKVFGTSTNMVCAGLGDSCPAQSGPGKVFGTPSNMVCAGLGDPCPAQNGQGKVYGTTSNMVCAGPGDPCPTQGGSQGKVVGVPPNVVCAGPGDPCPAPNGQQGTMMFNTSGKLVCTSAR